MLTEKTARFFESKKKEMHLKIVFKCKSFKIVVEFSFRKISIKIF